MNLIPHLLKKDIHRSRVLLIVWLSLVILEGVLISFNVNPSDHVRQALYTMISTIVPLLEALLLVVIVPFVVHEEPLVGTTAFWLTRPLSGSLLLKSKTLYAAAVLILPVLLVQVIMLAANGVQFHDLMLAVPEVVMNHLNLIAVLAVVAVLTPTFGRFAIVGVVALVVWLAVFLSLQWARMFFDPQYYARMGQNLSLEKSLGVVSAVTIILVAGAVVAHQYLSRKTRRSIVTLSIGFIVVIVIQNLWKWNFLERHIPSSGAAPFAVSAVKIKQLKNVFVNEVGAVGGVGAPTKEVRADLIISGVPDAYLIRAERIRASLQAPDGTPVTAKDWRLLPSLSFQSYEKALSSTLGGASIVNAEMWNLSTALFTIESADYNKYHTQPLKFGADVDFTVYKYAITEEMPAAKGAHFEEGSRRASITEVLTQPDGIQFGLKERRPNLLFDRGNNNLVLPDPGFWHFYLLFNRKRHEAVLQKRDNLSMVFELVRGQSMLVNHAQLVSFGPEPNYKRTTPDFTPEWLADATLVRVDLVPVYKILSKRFVVEKFKLDERNTTFSASELD